MGNFSINNTNGTNRLFTDVASGRVGIGVKLPAETFAVSGNASVHNMSIRITSGTGALIFHNGNSICIGSC